MGWMIRFRMSSLDFFSSISCTDTVLSLPADVIVASLTLRYLLESRDIFWTISRPVGAPSYPWLLRAVGVFFLEPRERLLSGLCAFDPSADLPENADFVLENMDLERLLFVG